MELLIIKYKKKPVVIEATQWFQHGDHAKVKIFFDGPGDMTLGRISTLEGDLIVTPGDYIITGIKGEHYPCKPDIFEATYEKVEE